MLNAGINIIRDYLFLFVELSEDSYLKILNYTFAFNDYFSQESKHGLSKHKYCIPMEELKLITQRIIIDSFVCYLAIIHFLSQYQQQTKVFVSILLESWILLYLGNLALGLSILHYCDNDSMNSVLFSVESVAFSCLSQSIKVIFVQRKDGAFVFQKRFTAARNSKYEASLFTRRDSIVEFFDLLI